MPAPILSHAPTVAPFALPQALPGDLSIFAPRLLPDGRWEILAPNPVDPCGPAWMRIAIIGTACNGGDSIPLIQPKEDSQDGNSQ
jgi:hypothetical protein